MESLDTGHYGGGKTLTEATPVRPRTARSKRPPSPKRTTDQAWRRQSVRADVLATKLRIPALPNPWLRRDRLDAMLSASSAHGLTVVTGPAGAGKTVALSGWSGQRPDLHIAWMTAQASDDEPGTFWSNVAAALNPFAPGPLDDDERRQVVDLLETINSSSPLTLIVDDFHVITNPSILSDMGFMIRNLAAHIHLILSSREDPRLPLHRMRMSGDVLEIHEQDLRFDTEEASHLLEEIAGRPAGSREVAVLSEKTEGWAAGLMSAGKLLRQTSDPSDVVDSFAGDDPDLVAYLVPEVLEPLPDKIYRFLITTSVLENMNESLCRRVSGLSDVANILKELSAQNLFLVRSNVERGWYRYHRLFGELLRHLSLVHDPESFRAAHKRAGDWYDANGDTEAAVRHFAAAGDFDRAFSLAANNVVHQLETGLDPNWTTRELDDLPIEYLQTDPLRMYALVTGLFVGLRQRDGELWLHRLARSTTGRALPWLVAREELLWALRDWMMADAKGVLQHSGTAKRLDGQELPALPDDVSAEHPWIAELEQSRQSILATLTARAHNWLGDHQAARQALADISEGPDSIQAVIAPGILAVAAAREGRLSECQHLANESLSNALRLGLGESVTTIDAHVAMGILLLERDELEEAERHILTACRLCRNAGREGWLADVEQHLVSIRLAQGRPDEAFAVIANLQHKESIGQLPVHVRNSLNVNSIVWRLAIGDFDQARLNLDHLPVAARPVELQAKVDLRAGRPVRAVARLTESAESAAPVSLRIAIERLVLLAHGRLQLGAQRQARDVIRRALDLARPERYFRIFLDEGEDIRWLLESLETSFPTPTWRI